MARRFNTLNEHSAQLKLDPHRRLSIRDVRFPNDETASHYHVVAIHSLSTIAM